MNPDLLRQLHDPATYPHRPESVQVVQTHISVVCLAGDRVYKLKKPVRMPFLDFSTRELREHFCREELRLNRRLCGAVYREVVELCEQGGRCRFGGPGRAVEHALVMERLPEERMMDHLLDAGAVTGAEVRAIAARLFAFHREHPVYPSAGEPGHPDQWVAAVDANFAELARAPAAVVNPELLGLLRRRAERDREKHLPSFVARVQAGRVVEGHGDLHARNVCLTDPPTLFDCIEFSERLRCGDVATENAFLLMDLRYRGRQDLAGEFLAEYCDRAGDREQPVLVPPLIRYRALVRAKVAALLAADPDVEAERRDAAEQEGRRYLQLAAATAAEGGAVRLIAGCGLPASGKSWVLGALAEASGWPVLASDRLRKEMAGVPPSATLPASWYEEDAVRRVYRELLRRGLEVAGERPGVPVLLDATFRSRSEREALRRAAASVGGQSLLVHFALPPEEALRRLEARGRDAVSDAGIAAYHVLREWFEDPAGEPGVLGLDGRLPAASLVDRILSRLLRAADS